MKSPDAAETKTPVKLLIESFSTLQELDGQIAKLQSELDVLPAREAAIAQDRTKTPREIREGLAMLKDQATDLRTEQERAMEDRGNVLLKAAQEFGPCTQIIYHFHKGAWDKLVNEATAALSPFFAGTNEPMDDALKLLPTVRSALNTYVGCTYRLMGENNDERLRNFIAVITECRLQ